MATLGRTLVAVGLVLAIAGACAVGEVQTPSCRTALVIIDVQSAWLGPDALTIDGVLVQEKVAGIAATARANGIPVVFVKDIAYRYRFTDQQLEIAPPLAILDGDRLVEKTHPNGFAETPLAELLRTMGITTLLISGYASHECVSATVAGALAQGFEVIIVADGHSGGAGDFWAKKQNLIWAQSGLQVILSAEIDFASLCASSNSDTGGQSTRLIEARAARGEELAPTHWPGDPARPVFQDVFGENCIEAGAGLELALQALGCVASEGGGTPGIKIGPRSPSSPQPVFVFTNPPADGRVVHAGVIGDLLLGVAVLGVRACDACGIFRVADKGCESMAADRSVLANFQMRRVKI